MLKTQKKQKSLRKKATTHYVDFLSKVYIGDIVISREKVEEQGIEYGHGFNREFCYLVAHGMFHLMGYDHMSDNEKAVMRAKEEEVMKKLNLER